MADRGIIKFELARMNFCMFADHILEIMRYPGVRKIPCPLPYVVGIMELRRHIVTVVDLHKRVGLAPISLTKDTVMIVVTLSSGTFGILVDNISDFRRIPEEQILPPISIAGLPEQLLHGVLTGADDILPIPDFDKIFSSYLHIRLEPINSSEKIAFQYRFTPGSLTQTLEKNLLARQTLDDEIVRKLPHSLYVPSTKVHRMTTYYADFWPQCRHREDGQTIRSTRSSRAADEHYALLSHDMASPSPSSKKMSRGNGLDENGFATNDFLAATATMPAATTLEHALHQFPDVISSGHDRFSKAVRLLHTLGRPLAQHLQLAPVRIARYFFYYHSASRAERQKLVSMPRNGSSRQTRLPRDRDWPSTKNWIQNLLTRVHTLHQEHRTLTPDIIRRFCTEYHVSSLKLARILSFFPEYHLAIDLGNSTVPEESAPEDQSQTQTRKTSQQTADVRPMLDLTSPYLADCLWQLVDQKKHLDPPTMRYVAAQRDIPTCRLSKFQLYYW